jgi:hypothetical protein
MAVCDCAPAGAAAAAMRQKEAMIREKRFFMMIVLFVSYSSFSSYYDNEFYEFYEFLSCANIYINYELHE